MEQIERQSIQIPRELYERLKKICEKADLDLESYFSGIIDGYVLRREEEQRKLQSS